MEDALTHENLNHYIFQLKTILNSARWIVRKNNFFSGVRWKWIILIILNTHRCLSAECRQLFCSYACAATDPVLVDKETLFGKRFWCKERVKPSLRLLGTMNCAGHMKSFKTGRNKKEKLSRTVSSKKIFNAFMTDCVASATSLPDF